MTPDSVFKIVDRQLMKIQKYPLNPVELIILEGIWQDLSYDEIGQQKGYSSGYLSNVAAPKLYNRLSLLIGENIKKKSCRTLLEWYASVPTKVHNSLAYPTGAIQLDSAFYIQNPPLEEQACEEIDKPGALIRIKAPKEMGKTSLLLRILNYAVEKDYQTVALNFAQIDCEILSDLNRFLRFLCASASQQLNLESKLDEYWDEDIGSKVSCSLYFRCYLLEQIDVPIVLAFDELNRIFEYPNVAKDVLPLLRSWYEDAKRTPVWQKLRQIVVHSTEVYIPLKVNQSPFNVGLPIELKGFNLNQVQELAEKYQLNWQKNEEARQLIDLVGGHPALIQIALYHLSQKEATLVELLKTASTPEGIYHHHLLRKWLILQHEPELAQYFRILLQSDRSLQLEPIIAYKLSSMGLINSIGNKVVVSCRLYQAYFTQNFVAVDSEDSETIVTDCSPL
ncbi:MAG: serine/threonine protein kinase [Hydrococcus sp. SU_1_0]|nr:serine/threonine protein kinase [Hydrococcus sp. SU_1_0]NJO95053.1 serine/threonine protein kinase [Pleurocapsa sp. CRU_1_2]